MPVHLSIDKNPNLNKFFNKKKRRDAKMNAPSGVPDGTEFANYIMDLKINGNGNMLCDLCEFLVDFAVINFP